MDQIVKNNKLFQASHLLLLVGHSVMSAVLIFESIRVGWERWGIVLVASGVVASWMLHLRRLGSPEMRMWIYGVLISITFFFYGAHPTSRFDMIAIIAAVIILFTMTAIRGLVTMAQITYYVTMAYNLTEYFIGGGKVEPLLISRIVLHMLALTMIAWFGRTIIKKWIQVLGDIHEEVEDLTEKTARLDDFLANASHEIRTPVNAVVGLTGVCFDRGINEENRNDLIAVRTAGHRVADQMSDILDYSEIDRGILVVNSENYMISSVLSDVVAKLKPYMDWRVELILDVDPAIPAVLYGDVGKLKKILIHLLTNGLKYTNDGGVYMRLTTQEAEYGVNLCIDIRDTGIGMTSDEIDHIFERFYQVDSSRSRVQGGLGLGMHLVEGFVSAMGGFLTVRSEPGVGTEVHVCIPQKVVDPSGCLSVADRENVTLGAFFAFNKYSVPAVREFYGSMISNIVKGMGVKLHGVDSMDNLKKLIESEVYISHIFIGMKEYEMDRDLVESVAEKIPVYLTADPGYPLPAGSKIRFFEKPLYCFPVISAINASREVNNTNGRMVLKDVRALVVDDEPMNLIVAKSIFGGYGMTVETAASGPESIDMCQKYKYDIVFMDHMMPGMDGVEAMKRIKGGLRGKQELAVVALTANTVSMAREMFAREGFDGFIGKPIETSELERTLKQVLSADKILYVQDEDELPEDVKKIIQPSGSVKKEKRMPSAEKAVEPSVPKEEKPDISDPEFYKPLRVFGLDDSIGLRYCQNDHTLYQAILKDFAQGAPDMVAYLDDKLADGDMKGYEIKIHSVKSTSRMVGAMDLGDVAERLEKAAGEEDIDTVRKNHNQAITLYTGLTEAIRKHC